MMTTIRRTVELPRISDYPAHHARTRPDAEAVRSDAVSITYSEFEAAIDAVARALLWLGVRRGDVVATLAPPSVEHLVEFMATGRIGAIWVGLNPRYQLAEFRHVIADAQPAVVFTRARIGGRDYRDELSVLARETGSGCRWVLDHGDLEGFERRDNVLAGANDIDAGQWAGIVAATTPDDPVLMVYTSGTTGAPKGALLSHRSVVTTARIQCEHWWAEPFRILNNMPINHIGGAVQIAAQAIVSGGTNVLVDGFDPVDLPRVIREHQVTITHQVATMYQLLLDQGRPTIDDMASMQTLIWSGAPASVALIRRLRDFDVQLFTSYGQTETGGEVLYTRPGADDEALSGTVGSPDPRIEVRLGALDGSGPSPDDEGEIQSRGPVMTLGYHAQSDATSAAWTADGWLRTGDLARRNPDGSYTITGRLKDMFKSGGYNVYPREIEIVLEQHPSVAMAAVVAMPDELFGEVGHAWVLTDDATVEVGDLERHCRQHLANYKVPKRFVIADDLPLLLNGKLDRRLLADRAAVEHRSALPYADRDTSVREPS